MRSKRLLICIVALFAVHMVQGQDQTRWRIEGGITFSHFQQQVKTAVGAVRGDRLVNEFQIGLMGSGTYRVTDILALGLFARADRGERLASRFDGFDATGKTQVKDAVGGLYSELWLGPMMQARWKQLSAEAGYALVGLRDDMARDDLLSSTGDRESAFTTHPTIAWLFTLGANIELVSSVEVILKIEYRANYYSKRGGNALVNDIEHGRQSINPIIGLAWQF